jgi:hypothetical protein
MVTPAQRAAEKRRQKKLEEANGGAAADCGKPVSDGDEDAPSSANAQDAEDAASKLASMTLADGSAAPSAADSSMDAEMTSADDSIGDSIGDSVDAAKEMEEEGEGEVEKDATPRQKSAGAAKLAANRKARFKKAAAAADGGAPPSSPKATDGASPAPSNSPANAPPASAPPAQASSTQSKKSATEKEAKKDAKDAKREAKNAENVVNLDELTPVELLDCVQVKLALDEALRNTPQLLEYGIDDYMDNLKMAIMIIACGFACLAQFGPIPFPEGRWILGAACAAYFICSGGLTLVLVFIEKDLVYQSMPLEKKGWPEDSVLLLHTALPRFTSDYKIRLQLLSTKTKETIAEKAVAQEHESIGNYFTADGYFAEKTFQGMIDEEVTLFKKTLAKKE